MFSILPERLQLVVNKHPCVETIFPPTATEVGFVQDLCETCSCVYKLCDNKASQYSCFFVFLYLLLRIFVFSLKHVRLKFDQFDQLQSQPLHTALICGTGVVNPLHRCLNNS